MGKKLSEMSLEELWELFPIFLTEHSENWKNWYQEEAKLLEQILPKQQVERISHVGSTAIRTIWAKPIIDILVEVSSDCNLQDIKNILTSNSYICMSQQEKRLSFNKGYTEHGFAEKVFHLHLRYAGDNDEIYFRDYLIEHPEIAGEYEALKLGLWKKYEHDRDAYTAAKTEFVSKYTQAAKQGDIEILFGSEEDLKTWMELVRKVRDVFPGLETEAALQEHWETVLDFMNRNAAICAKLEQKVVGALLFSREDSMLCFLAVDDRYRRLHIGQKMVNCMLEQMDDKKDIVVTTYREGVPEGIAARAFYRSMGFEPGKLTEEFGYPVQEFVLRR